MPVKLVTSLQRGWRTKNPEQRGDIVVIEFINESNNELLFTWGMKWEDVPVVIEAIESLFNIELKKLHLKNKGLLTFKEK